MPSPCSHPLSETIALFRRHELDAARAGGESVLAAAAGQPGGGDVQLQALWWLIRIARRQNRLDDALRFAHAGLTQALAADDAFHECRLRAVIARTLKDIGQSDEAASEVAAALQRATSAGDEHARAYALEALGSIHWISHEAREGLAVFEQLEPLARECRDLDLQLMALLGQASMHDSLANAAGDAGRLDEQRAHWQRALSLHAASAGVAEALGDRYLSAWCRLNRGCTLQISGAGAQARCLYEQLLAEPGAGRVHAQVRLFLAGMARSEGRPAESIPLLQRLIDSPELASKTHTLQMALAELVEAYDNIGDTKAALATMRRFHALHVANAAERASMRIRALVVQYQTDQAKAAAASQTQRAERLAHEAAEATRASLQDGLTGIANRRRFDEAVSRQGATGLAAHMGIALIDIDHFKQVNDRFSHAIGDAVLCRVAAVMAACCRHDDLLARYGGEEFVLLLRGIDTAAAAASCERTRAAVEAEPWASIAPGLAVTISIGCATAAQVGDAGIGALLALADQRLYAAKNAGRNRVVCGDSE